MTRGDGGEARFESAMRHSAIGMCLVAPDGSFLEVNEALCRMLGRDEAALRASTWQELTHPDDVAVDAALVREIVDGTRDTYRLSKRYLLPDGTVVHGDLSVVGMRDANGEIDYLISQVVDTTDQVRLRDRLQLLAEHATDVVALGDNDGVVQWVSDAVSRVTGWSPGDIEGRPWADFVHPDDHQVMRANQARLVAGEAVEMELRIRGRSGEYRWASFRVRPVLDDHGRPHGRVSSWWDSEDEHRTLAALRRSEEMFRGSLEAQSDTHMFLDAVRDESGHIVDFTIVDGNEAAVGYLGVPREAFAGRSLRGELPADRAAEILALYTHTVQTGEALEVDGWLASRDTDDGPHYFDLRGVKVGDGISVSARDVTERIRSAEALEESEHQARELLVRYEQARDEALEASAAKTVFLSRMSHELRTPLNAILGFAQLLELEDLTPDQREFVRHIRSGGRHLLGLVTEVLDVSRIESGGLTLSLEPVAVADAVDEAIDLVRSQAATAAVTVVRVECADCECHVRADRQRVIQVLVNLLSNGVKYNSRGGGVEVGCRRLDGNELAIRVADTGPGVPAEQLPRLFEPFDRLGAEQSAVEGTGIGLTLSKGLAQVMSGRIEVESVVGEGSVFSLVLPLTEPVAADRAPEEVVSAPVLGSAVDLLYVEDNPANRHLMAHIARLRPMTTARMANDGTAGLAAARERRPDLVLLDLHLPDLQGDVVLGRLRELPGMGAVPVVVVTADASPGLQERLQRLGADGVVTKPLDVDEVLAWIDRAGARKR